MPKGRFVSRAGEKLEFALQSFSLDVTGLHCADFGCNAGGFTDCLLKRGAATVWALDTGYGALDWNLRNDTRVKVMERTNALHAPAPPEGVDLVVIDLGWTPQRLAIPASLPWLTRSGGVILTLIKPHYEMSDLHPHTVRRGGLSEEEVAATLQRVRAAMSSLGVKIRAECESPLVGDKSSRKGAGNKEWFMLLDPAAAD
ncbi:MAG: TlyA family RNA methyltransferase [Phycisphaerales bacterium]|nr:TlyA family RNA methyltransferase [Phycisphaerales bacterium]